MDNQVLPSRTEYILVQPAATTTVRQRDYLTLALVAMALILVTSIPFVFAKLLPTGDRQFMGIVSDVPDTAQYFAWQRAHQQSLLVSNWMTPEPNAPAFFNALWLLLGWLSLHTGLGFDLTFQILRVVAGAAFVASLFWLYGLLADGRRERWQATLLVLLGGGIGWVWLIEKWASKHTDLLFPLDVQVAEPNTFLSMLGFPHFVLAGALVLTIFGLFFAGVEGRSWWPFGVAAVLALLLGVQHAYDLLTVYLVLGAFVLLRWWVHGRFPVRDVVGLVAIGLVSSPPAAYFTLLTSRDPMWRQVLAQFANADVYTPNPLHLVVLLGPQLVLAWLALPRLLRRRNLADLFLVAWLVVGFGLLYIPTDFQIHMLNPYQVPLALLAVRAVSALAARASWQWLRTAAPIVLLFVAIPVNLYLLSWRVLDLARQDAPYFLHRDEVAAIEWLNNQPDNTVVLSDETLGQYVPALAGKRTVLAHWAQTVDYYGKRDAVARFFDTATPATERTALLDRFDVAYVLVGENELRDGVAAALDSQQFERVFAAAGAEVYRVK